MPGQTIRLSHPLRILDSGARGPTRERVIRDVVLRAPNGRDLLLLDQHQGRPVGLALALIQRLSGLTRIQVGKLAAPDVEALSRAAIDAVAPGFNIAEQAGGLSHQGSDKPT